MNEKLKMVTRTRFGHSNKATLSPALLTAIAASGPDCAICVEIQKEVEVSPEGAEFVEAASFPGRTVEKLNAHFKFHWKDGYELVDLALRPPSTT